MLLAFQRGETLHTSLRTKTRIQPHISPLAEQTDRGSSLIKYHQITGSPEMYFCKPVLHSFLVSYRKHLHLEWPGLQGTSANQIETSHHLLARWQGQVRRCLKTIHAINLFPPKWLPINCFTLTKDGLQTLNITCLRAKSGSNCLDLLHWSYLKFPSHVEIQCRWAEFWKCHLLHFYVTCHWFLATLWRSP